MQRTKKEEDKKERTQKCRRRSKKKEKLPIVRRWVPSRNQRHVGNCYHKIISFSKNCLKRKKVCFFSVLPEFNKTSQNGWNRLEWTEIQSEVERGGDSYRLSDWNEIFRPFWLVRNEINHNVPYFVCLHFAWCICVCVCIYMFVCLWVVMHFLWWTPTIRRVALLRS